MNKPWTSNFGWLLAIIGLVLTVVFWAVGKLDPTHALLFALAFLSVLL